MTTAHHVKNTLRQFSVPKPGVAAMTAAIRELVRSGDITSVRRRPASGLVFHSDRGCQYTSAQHARLAAAHGIRLSVGRRGQCWDNAVAEAFFSTIKTELLHRQPWPTHTAARQAIFEYIEGWYNTRRRHSSLGYLSPATFEATGSHQFTADSAA